MDSDDEDHELEEVAILTVRNNLLVLHALQMMAMEHMESSDEKEEGQEVVVVANWKRTDTVVFLVLEERYTIMMMLGYLY